MTPFTDEPLRSLLAPSQPRGHAFLDRTLYLPQAWAADAARREAAGIPPEITFATKGDLAQAMLARAFAAEVPAAWVTGDEIYGNDGDLRRYDWACARLPYWTEDGWTQWLLLRRWQGWYRHSTLCLLAHAFLEVTRAAAADGEKGGSPPT